MWEEDILNLAIAEELIKEINPSVTQERVQEIWSVCMGESMECWYSVSTIGIEL